MPHGNQEPHSTAFGLLFFPSVSSPHLFSMQAHADLQYNPFCFTISGKQRNLYKICKNIAALLHCILLIILVFILFRFHVDIL